MTTEALIWCAIAATALADCILFPLLGMSAHIETQNLVVLGALFAFSLAIRQRNANASRFTSAIVQFLALSFVVPCLSYALMATTPYPYADTMLSSIDSLFGFDWLAWYDFVHSHAWLHYMFAKAYNTIEIQLLALGLWFGYANRQRIDELLLSVILALAVVLVGMVAFPAIGALSHYGIGVEPWRYTILALRDHTFAGEAGAIGIVTFPSFHAICAVLLANMARRSRLFAPVLLLNVCMVLSTPSEGAHYGVDVLAGVLVAVAAIAAARAIMHRLIIRREIATFYAITGNVELY